MTDGIGTPQDFMSFDRGRSSPIFVSLLVSGASALVLSTMVGALVLDAYHTAVPRAAEMPAVAPAAKTPGFYGVRAAAANAAVKSAKVSRDNSASVYGTLAAAVAAVESDVYGALVPMPVAPDADNTADKTNVARLDRPPSANATAVSRAQEPLQGPDAPRGLDVASNPPPSSIPPSSMAPGETEQIPVPPPRPRDGGLLAGRTPLRAPSRQVAAAPSTIGPPPAPSVSPPAPSDKNDTFFRQLFGMLKPSEQALAYASPDEGVPVAGRRNISAAVLPYGRDTAVYDIAAHTVYMPDGTKLEAHSGLGSELDDPHYVNVKMRGATPPHVYELKPRETLFHGVQALRLLPIGAGDVFGRTGLLAHSYMLGPNGQSNGCVSFKNYNAFLQAYMKGEIKRLVVVAGLN